MLDAGAAVRAAQAVQTAKSTPAGAKVAVVENYHAAFDHYFITSLPDEIAKLDNGTFVGWTRTGSSFNVYASADAPSWRVSVGCFFSTTFAPKSSHFHSALVNECEGLRSNPNWQFEDYVSSVVFPAIDGSCPIGHAPVYRVDNSGQGGSAQPSLHHRSVHAQPDARAGLRGRGLWHRGLDVFTELAPGSTQSTTSNPGQDGSLAGHEDPHQHVEQQTRAAAQQQQDEQQAPDPGFDAGGARDATAHTRDPSVARAAPQGIDRRDGRRGWRLGRFPRAIQYAGLGARELVVGQGAALMQILQFGQFVAQCHPKPLRSQALLLPIMQCRRI
jgi:hypothetical protein